MKMRGRGDGVSSVVVRGRVRFAAQVISPPTVTATQGSQGSAG